MSGVPSDRFDTDGDGVVTDADLAAVPPSASWWRVGLRGPAIVLRWFTRNAKRLLVLVVGLVVVTSGAVMLVLPGPGVIVLLVGFAILATEFAWAERALDATAGRASRAAVSMSGNRAGRVLLVLSGVAMLAAGVAGAVVVPRWRLVALSLGLAGASALVTLLPAVQRWMERQHRRPAGHPVPPVAPAPEPIAPSPPPG